MPLGADTLPRLLVRGCVSGLVAGLTAGAFAFVVAEPLIEHAIELEALSGAAGGSVRAHADEVSRETQRIGLLAATGIAGAALGVLFALAFGAVRGRTGPASALALALSLGALFAFALTIVPFAKYPPAPPGVGAPHDLAERTILYLVLIAGCALSLLAAARAARTLPRAPAWARLGAGAVTAAATVAIAVVVLPPAAAAPASMPDSLLRDFRLASVATQLLLWLGIACLFGVATARAQTCASRPRGGARAARRTPVPR